MDQTATGSNWPRDIASRDQNLPSRTAVEHLFSRSAQRLKGSDIRGLLRFASNPGVISLAGGLPAKEFFDVEGIRLASEEALSQSPADCLQYGMTEGQPRLRAAASGLLAQRGIRVEENELVITTGSQQAIDLTARSILNEGDLVAVERPTYVAALQAFDLNSPRYVSIPVDQEGGQVQKLLEFASSGTLPKLVYLVPNFANPSGACLSLERRVWLARFAVQHGVFVLEDDPYGELRLHGSPLPSIYEIARSTPGAEKWCAYLTTLSKTMSPGLRIGALAGPEQFIDKITLLKQAADLHTSSFNQEVAARYLEGDRLQGRLDLIRREYRERQNCLIDEITSAFGSAMSLLTPEGGMFLWGRFRDGTDTRELLKHAIAAGVIYVPGDCFYVEQPDRSAIRLNFSAAPPEVIRLGVARLKYAHERYLSAFNGSGSSERRLELLGQRVLARVQRST